MNASLAPMPPMQWRDVRMDFWRGSAILMIFINHLDFNLLSVFTTRAWGLSDAAELLVFLAGLGMARILVAKRERGVMPIVRYVGNRIGRLYVGHLILLLGIGLICAIHKVVTSSNGFVKALHYDALLEHPAAAISEALTLTYLPAYADILPLYIILTICAGLAILVFRAGWPAIMATSAAVYAFALISGFNFPAGEHGRNWFFNPFCWQLLFMTGMSVWMGRNASWFRTYVRSSVTLTISAIIVGVGIHVAAPWTYWGLPPGSGLLAQWLGPYLDKQYLSLLRYLHFLAVAHIAYIIVDEASLRRAAGRAVARIGQNAVPTFIFSTLLATMVQAYGQAAELQIAGYITMAALGLCAIFGFSAAYRIWTARDATVAASTVPALR